MCDQPNCDPLPLAGKRVVQVPKNDCQLVDLRGVVAVMSEKHKPGTMSDGALLRGAYQAGAAAVIKIGGGGGSICSRWEEVNRRLEVPSWKLTYPLLKVLLKMIFLFPRWDMSVSWKVSSLLLAGQESTRNPPNKELCTTLVEYLGVEEVGRDPDMLVESICLECTTVTKILLLNAFCCHLVWQARCCIACQTPPKSHVSQSLKMTAKSCALCWRPDPVKDDNGFFEMSRHMTVSAVAMLWFSRMAFISSPQGMARGMAWIPVTPPDRAFVLCRVNSLMKNLR